ncbi:MULTISPECIES: glycine zipper 2TM domain-containing protein [unclassified Cupriavidus]
MSGCTATGAVAGGVVGHEVSDGSALGTVGGAVVGGVIGHELGK